MDLQSSEPQVFDLPYISSSSQASAVHLFSQRKHEWHFRLLEVFVSSEMHFSFAALVGEMSDSTSGNAGIKCRITVGEGEGAEAGPGTGV